ncbi:MAG: PIN domain-containing protein [Sphaerochaetaceae bacterium]|nr:PIN domain-containing protein [Sphaerochaetaceae bacterium]
MILLDTNYLIRALVDGTMESMRITEWITEGEELITSAISWYEFLCGPVDSEGILVVSALIEDRIISLTRDQSKEASRLYTETGRKRNLRVDAMIAAAAMVSNASLATENRKDFERFTAFGLQLVD